MLAILIGVNLAAFVFQTIVGLINPHVLTQWFALSRWGLGQGYLWQFVTYMFLHGGVLHLLINMLMLYFAGREVQSWLGPRHLLGIYFIGGLVGGIAHLLLSPASVVGASAGASAVLIAFTAIVPNMEITLLLFFVLPVRLKAKYFAWGFVAVSLFFIFTGTGGNVAHIAHLGGAALGWIYVKRLGYGAPLGFGRFFPRRPRHEQPRRDTRSDEEFISSEIDPILDKISREGLHSLTRAERRILEKGRDKIAKRTSRKRR